MKADARTEVSVSISESALDGWWETLDTEIKITLFNHFYEPLDEEPEAETA